MSYKEKPQIKLYKYENSAFILQAIIDDYQESSFENNRFSAGQFSITINYNIPNARLFARGLWVQFGNDPYAFGEILNVTDSIGEDGKGSQLRVITGFDARYIFKRRIIKNLNNVENWQMTAKGEICMRNLIKDQCGSGAEVKRQLPITNVIPDVADAIGKSYSVAESFTNLYEVLVTIATQTEIGWRINFNGSLSLEFYEGTDRHLTVRFDTDYESLSNGEFKDSAEAFANSVYVGGKGTGSDRDIYEGESAIEGESPSGLERFEAWDNQSSMNTESEYEAEALSVLNQYGQTLQVSGQGLAKCPYEYGKEYEVGDTITIAFSGKSAIVQILSVTEHWAFGAYDLEFSFGKPQPDFDRQMQLILKQIQKASNKSSATSSVKWYTIPTDTAMPAGDVVYDTIGFVGNCASGGSTFTLYLDNEKTGAKTYHVYFKQLGGGKLTLTTGKAGATNLVMNPGTYVAIIYVDPQGNITMAGATATNVIEAGNNLPATSEGVYQAIQSSALTVVNVVEAGNMSPVTSGAVFTAVDDATLYCQKGYTLDLRGLSTSNFYPVIFPSTDLELDCEIHSPNRQASDPYNQNRIHFLLTYQGWSDSGSSLNIISYSKYQVNEVTIGAIGGGGRSGGNVVWIRGGMIYRFICNQKPTLHTSDYTDNEQKYTVGTSFHGGTNVNVNIKWEATTS